MTTAELHPGLAPMERALDRVEPILPLETDRARRHLADALAPITQSVWPEISHRLSLLTNTGFPVEFSWSSRYTALRWTAEVAGPETPKEDLVDPEEASHPWYQRTLPLAGIAFVLVIILNVSF